jgi:DNA-binding IclR family transcriptional regulator
MAATEQTLMREEPGLASVDLVLSMVELLAAKKRSYAMSDIAREMGISKSRTHRHLRALMRHGYVVQDAETERYAIGTKLLAIGETVRDRFDVLAATQSEIGRLRDETGQTVTVSTLIDDAVVVLELLRGKTVVEFGVRPGSTLDFHASAHGLVALAFGPPRLAEKVLARHLKAWTASTLTDPDKLRKQIDKVRAQRWATAADQFLVGVNTLAVPIFDFRNEWRGTIAIVGATQFIRARPSDEQIAQVSASATEASRRLGWRTNGS